MSYNLTAMAIKCNNAIAVRFFMSQRVRYKQRVNLFYMSLIMAILFVVLIVRLGYVMVIRNDYYATQAQILHERERAIKASRGRILDRNGNVLADNKRVCTISVIHNQIEDRERVINSLSEILDVDYDTVAKKVDKYSSIERIKANVDIEKGNEIKKLNLKGVKIDEDYKRFYPYDELASKVIGFTGADNQGIIGLEVKYDELLKGKSGTIFTLTDAVGVELPDEVERREEPVSGSDLYLTLDLNIQSYASQLAQKALEQHNADSVSIIVMNPQNGEIYACVNEPEFSLNNPYSIPEELKEGVEELSQEEEQEILNSLWRNECISDTYEPGSVFKIITATAALESGSSSLEDTFYCPGHIVVEDRIIHCHKRTGHGSQTFTEATMNSCKPEFDFA